MAEAFLRRTEAKDYAVKQGWTSFRTKLDPSIQMWRVHYEREASPALEWAKGREFIAWIETAWIGGDDETAGQKTGVVIVTITQEELKKESIPPEFLVEPITPDLWKLAPYLKTKTEKALEHGQKPSRKPRKLSTEANELSAPKTEQELSQPLLERSTAMSPVKIVWETCDGMQGIDRKSVIAACVEKGVHPGTAATQYSKWRRNKEQSA